MVADPNNSKSKSSSNQTNSVKFWRTAALILLGLAIITQLFSIKIEPRFNLFRNLLSQQSTNPNPTTNQQTTIDTAKLRQAVVPTSGVELPISWGDLGKRMISDGVIDEQKFRALFSQGLKNDQEQMLSDRWDEKVVLNQDNSRFMLDLLWAFGLANKNTILEEGEITDQKYGGDVSKFASTGGWSLSRTPVMEHYSNHSYVVLNSQQQQLVTQVSKNIYRPCCGNSTYFPDCNHGMAMLGLLELMAANGADEDQLYQVALKVNSIWFPQTYIDLATYFKEQGQDWDQVDPKLALSADYSSARGYQQTRQQIKSLPKPQQGGGSCGA